VTNDPQDVPEAILNRAQAADPKAVLDSPLWRALVEARDGGDGRLPRGAETLRDLRGSAKYVSNPPEAKPWPPAKPTPRKAAPATAQPISRRIRNAIKSRL
jgi:hypothetical protein